MTYQLSPFAEEDLDKIWHYVAEQASEDTADKIVYDIVDGCVMLARYPNAGRLRPDLGPDVRCIVVEKYLVYYRVEREVVLISRVFHGSRDQVAAWQESPEQKKR